MTEEEIATWDTRMPGWRHEDDDRERYIPALEVEGERREFSKEPLARPPIACYLCNNENVERDFHSTEDFKEHIAAVHVQPHMDPGDREKASSEAA